MLAVALLTLAGSGCRTSIVRKSVQRRLERRLNAWVGPAASYRVRIVDTPDSELVLGRARRVEIEGARINARSEFLIDSMKLVLIDLRYEGGEPDFISVRRSDLDVEFGEAALQDYLKRAEARYDPHVKIEPDLIRVSMLYPFLGTPTPLKAVGRLVVQEGRRLLFQADSAEVAFATNPEFARKFVEDRVNPLLDLGRIDFPARLESVQLLQGRVRAHGSAALRKEIPD